MVINLVEWAARFVVHYPQYLLICAAVNRIDIYFWAYAGVNVLYLSMSMAEDPAVARKVSDDMIKRAILIAAGRGRRPGPHPEEVPKCMVEIGGKPILGWVWEALSSVGVDELIVIRGYRGDVLETFVRGLVPNVTFVDNREWETNNVLLSLAHARAFFDRPTYITYSDIVFTPAVAAPAAPAPGLLRPPSLRIARRQQRAIRSCERRRGAASMA